MHAQLLCVLKFQNRPHFLPIWGKTPLTGRVTPYILPVRPLVKKL